MIFTSMKSTSRIKQGGSMRSYDGIQSLDDEFKDRVDDVTKEILSLNQDAFATDFDLLVEKYYRNYEFRPIEISESHSYPPEIEECKIKIYNTQTSDDFSNTSQISVSGRRMRSYFCFKGDDIIYDIAKGTCYLSGNREYEVDGNTLILVVEETTEKIRLNRKILADSTAAKLNELKLLVDISNEKTRNYNTELHHIIRIKLDQRRDELIELDELKKFYNIPIVQINPKMIELTKRVSVQSILNMSESNSINYSISESSYQDILSIVKHQLSTIERLPLTFTKFSEQELRDILLAALNAVLKGKASGETFRAMGKTDICIEAESRAAFIAECKFWDGIKSFNSAINQLQSYSTWRDNKLALIVFSKKNKDFFKVIDEVESELNKVESLISLKKQDHNEFELKFTSHQNSGQIIRIKIFILNMFVSKKITIVSPD